MSLTKEEMILHEEIESARNLLPDEVLDHMPRKKSMKYYARSVLALMPDDSTFRRIQLRGDCKPYWVSPIVLETKEKKLKHYTGKLETVGQELRFSFLSNKNNSDFIKNYVPKRESWLDKTVATRTVRNMVYGTVLEEPIARGTYPKI